MIAKCYEKIKSVIPAERLFPDEPMSKHTTFKIGGPADLLVMPSNVEEVAYIIETAHTCGVPFMVIGNGSNMLVLDNGIRGIVIKIGKYMANITHNGSVVTAGAGALLADVSKYALRAGLAGMEFAIGIPGSVGGAVFMNAGAYDGEMSHVVKSVAAVCLDGKTVRFDKQQICFAYRHSVFQENNAIICEVELELHNGEPSDIDLRMGDYTNKRITKQPIDMPSAGSTFKRPPGNFAGTLIEKAGLKGLRIGGAQVSTKHAGFIVNTGGATARDVLELIKEVQNRVYADSGIMLQPEVRIVGEQ